MSGKYLAVSGTIFCMVAVLQAARAVMHLPVQVGSFEVPVLASWVATVVAGSLCVWAFQALRQR